MTEDSSPLIALPNAMNVETVTASGNKLEGSHPLVLCQQCDQNDSFTSPMARFRQKQQPTRMRLPRLTRLPRDVPLPTPINFDKPKPIHINCDDT